MSWKNLRKAQVCIGRWAEQGQQGNVLPGTSRSKPVLRRLAIGVAALLLLGSGTATATAAGGGGFNRNLNPNAAPSTRPAAGPAMTPLTATASRPVSGKTPTAGPGTKDASGVWQVTTPRVKLSNTVTNADGGTMDLTFEVWTADSSGNAKTRYQSAVASTVSRYPATSRPDRSPP